MDQLNLSKIAAVLYKLSNEINLNENPIISYKEFEEQFDAVDPRLHKAPSFGTSHRELRERNGKLWLVKIYGHPNDISISRGSPDEQAFWEWVTALLMRAAGFKVPRIILVTNHSNLGILLSEFYTGAGKDKVVHYDQAANHAPVKNKLFGDLQDKGLWPLLAILAHWDWAGLERDNILVEGTKDENQLIYIDTSAGKFRAQGAEKPIFSRDITGLSSFDKAKLKQDHKEDIHRTLDTLKAADRTGVLKHLDQEGRQKAFGALLPKIDHLQKILTQIAMYAKQKGVNVKYIRDLEHYEMRLEAFKDLYEETYGS